MKTPDYIDRIGPDPDGLDFDALRKAGVAMLQELCGERWTDYNLHDPGVTIFEQLCYGITDLAYRSDFAPEDYLAGKHGKIDFVRHALHKADTIFPSQVLTIDDYRKIIYDSIPEIEDVWLTCGPGNGSHAGLYKISLKIRESLQVNLEDEEQAQLVASVTQKVIEVFHANRNLGEDIGSLEVVGTQPVYLSGDIQIHSLRDPAAILAEIFFGCSRQVMTGFRTERYLDAREAGTPLEQIFAGPRTEHGRIISTGAVSQGAPISMPRLISLVQSVDGVAHVQRLFLCDEQGVPLQGDSIEGKVLRLRFPEAPQSGFLRLHFASGAVGNYGALNAPGTQLQADKMLHMLDDARVSLRKIRFEFDTTRHTVQTLEQVVPTPQGVQRPLHEYYSIQNQFPAIYGINRFGVPKSAPLHNQVSARQLKAYLYLAEQLMANYLQNLQSIPQVFSVDSNPQTYFSQVIDDQALPHIEQLYVTDLHNIGLRLQHIVARIDKPEDRRSRVIDVLLAMYGEEFSQKSLRRFNYYDDPHDSTLVDNKLSFLKNIVTLSRNRASAPDITQGQRRRDRRANVAGMHRKIAILLGLPINRPMRELCSPLQDRQLRLVSGEGLSADDYAHIASHLLQLAHAHETSAEVAPVSAQVLPAAMLTRGVRLDNYLIEQADDLVHVHFQTNDEQSGLVQIGSHVDMSAAEQHVQKLRQFFCMLNSRSEGFYLVEHILLRARSAHVTAAPAAQRKDAEDFYSSRISVVFPAWSARFCDPDFRQLAQETVCRNFPAHLLPQFYWLDFVAMRDFEQRHRVWLEQLRRHADGSNVQRLDQASASLVSFLQRQRERQDGDQLYWL